MVCRHLYLAKLALVVVGVVVGGEGGSWLAAPFQLATIAPTVGGDIPWRLFNLPLLMETFL